MRIIVYRETPDGGRRPHEVVVDRYIARAKGVMIGTWGESWFRAREIALVLLGCEPWELELETVSEEPEHPLQEEAASSVRMRLDP